MITENMQNFKLANEDRNFVNYQQKTYEQLFQKLERLPKEADRNQDVDLIY